MNEFIINCALYILEVKGTCGFFLPKASSLGCPDLHESCQIPTEPLYYTNEILKDTKENFENRYVDCLSC